MPILLAIMGLLSVGGLVFKTITDETQETAQKVGPSIVTIGALALAGLVVYKTLAKKGK